MKTELQGRLPENDGTPLSSESIRSKRESAIVEALPIAAHTPREIHRQVWKIAWPSVLTFSLMTTNSILDRAFVGTLGRDALAGVGFGGQVIFLLVSLSMAIAVGTTALVARFTGAGEHDNAVRATGQSITLGVLTGALCTFLVGLSLGSLLSVEGLTGEAQTQCRAFLYMALFGMVPMFLANVLSSAFRGLGDTRSPLKVMICVNIVHVLGDWTFMLGHWGAPKLGVMGAGTALMFSNTVGMIVYFVLLHRSSLKDALSRHNLWLDREWAMRILRIGVPAAVTALLRTTSLMGFTGVLTRTLEQTNAVAALPIGMTAESIAFMPGFGFSVAASALVGQSLGARDPDRAERFGWSAAWQSVAIMTIMGAVFFVAASPFTRLFTNDPAVHQIAVNYLQIMAFSEPFLAFGMVLTGALQGAGDTVKPTILVIVSQWLIRVPLAWHLALHLHYNANGAWVAMAVSTSIGGLLTVIVWRQGGWKRIKV